MIYSAILPRTPNLPGWLAGPFTAFAHQTGALPFEIPGVARFGNLPLGEDAIAPLPPLLPLDGSPRPQIMPDLPDLVKLNDILDQRWSNLMQGIDAKNLRSRMLKQKEVKAVLAASLSSEADGTLREILARFNGSKELSMLARIACVASELRADRAHALAFAAGAFMACSDMRSLVPGEDDFFITSDIIHYSINFFFREHRPIVSVNNDGWADFSPIDFSYKGAGAIAAEAFADTISRNRGPAAMAEELRRLAADHWYKFLVLQTEDLSKGRIDIMVRRALNAAQADPVGSNLENIFDFYMSAPTFEDRVRNLVRGAWVRMLEEADMKSESYIRWHEISRNLFNVSAMLRGEHRFYSSDDHKKSFPRMQKQKTAEEIATLAGKVKALGDALLPPPVEMDEEERQANEKMLKAMDALKMDIPPWSPEYK